MEFVRTGPALVDLEQISDFIAQESPASEYRLTSRIVTKAAQMLEHRTENCAAVFGMIRCVNKGLQHRAEYDIRSDAVADNPMIGRRGRVSGTRELVISGTAYIVADRAGESVEILAVVHERRPGLKAFPAFEEFSIA